MKHILFPLVLILLITGPVFYKGYFTPILEFRQTLAAAQDGDAQAQMKMGDTYLRGSCEGGFPVRCDTDTGIKYLRMAADNNNAEAQFRVCSIYARGEGMVADTQAAVRWCEKSARQGHRLAQKFLGWIYLKAKDTDLPYGVAKLPKPDYAEAYFWLSLSTPKTYTACRRQWDEQSCTEKPNIVELEQVNRAERHLNPEEKTAIDKRIAEWTSSHTVVLGAGTAPLRHPRESGDPVP